MRKIFVFAAFIILPAACPAQYYWDFGVGLGISNYLGEIGGSELTRRDFVSDMKLSQSRQSANAFARYKLSNMFSVKASLSYITLRGADSLCANPARFYRNLNFRNYVWEGDIIAQFFFYEVNDLGHTYRYKDNFRAYVGLGAGGIYHNPKAYYKGEWVDLRPLQTEGHSYTKFAFVIPASAGFYFTINKRYRIGWDICWRTAFTDYLDDASSNYSEHPAGSLSGALSDRTNHAEADAYGAANGSPGFGNNYGYGYWTDENGNKRYNKRGDPTHNDSYITSNVEFSYVFRGKSSIYRSHYSSVFKGKKYKKRKVRAKF